MEIPDEDPRLLNLAPILYYRKLHASIFEPYTLSPKPHPPVMPYAINPQPTTHNTNRLSPTPKAFEHPKPSKP